MERKSSLVSTLPGFTALMTKNQAERIVSPAGFWDWLTGGDNSAGNQCTFSRTDTKCILFTMWCNNIFACGWNRSNNTVIEKDSGWYICGVCGNPFDW